MAFNTMKYSIFGKIFARNNFFFLNYINDFSETWYVTISDSIPSPLQVSPNFMERFCHYGLEHNEILGKQNYAILH